MSRYLCVGEAFVDLIGQPEVSELGASEHFRRTAGGAVSNVAIGIARLGGSVAFVGAVGRDPFGKFLIGTLAHEGVNVDGMYALDAPTPVIFVTRGPNGARDFFPMNCPGADTRLTADDLNQQQLDRARCLHFGGVTLAAEPGRTACMTAAMSAANALVSFDPNARPAIFPDGAVMRRVLLEACEAAHLVKCSHDDLAAMGMDEHDPGVLLRGATRAVVVTHGAEGCRWATKDGRSGAATAPRTRVIDTTGAGDAFMAALLWRVCESHDGDVGAASIADAVRWAIAAGAIACTREGSIAALPRRADLEAALAATQ